MKNNQQPGPSHWRADTYPNIYVARTPTVASAVLNAENTGLRTCALAVIPVTVAGTAWASVLDQNGSQWVALVLLGATLGFAPLAGWAVYLAMKWLRRRAVRAGLVLHIRKSDSPVFIELMFLADALTHQPDHVRERTDIWCAKAWDLLVRAAPVVAEYPNAVSLRRAVEGAKYTKGKPATREQVRAHAASVRAVGAYEQTTDQLLAEAKSLRETIREAVSAPERAAADAVNAAWKSKTAATLERVAAR